MKIDTLETLLQSELMDIYDAEKRLVRALPKIAKAASSEELREAIQEHLNVTKGQVERLEQVFGLFDFPVKAKTCAGMKGLIEEGEEVMSDSMNGMLRDSALIGAAQRVEHYEMAAYGTARTMAEQLGNKEAVDLLEETLNEEKEADAKLTEVAEQLFGQMGEVQPEEEDSRKSRKSRARVSRA
ncbi:MAG TPA: ferritin-like domain-containing protein [Bryobacteraceae bacterium]|nr:ferritin-like domain-containing protein [Bryobacteraceae bacterium]